jgi:peptidoglycan/xylan/chitin deacetylase (PgdA/CDA1 family)
MKKVVVVVVVVLLLPGLWGLHALSDARCFQVAGTLVARVETADSVMALTFDDGPTPAYTDQVLDLLRDRDVRATFYVTGSETEQNLDTARRIVEAGHELGNHSYTHPRLMLKRPSVIHEEVERTDAAIRRTGYAGPITFRPPDAKKLFALPLYLARTGRTTIMWDVEPESYPDVAANAEGITAHVLERVRPGSIVLMHLMYDGRATCREALPLVIDGLRRRGYRVVTVSERLALSKSPDP